MLEPTGSSVPVLLQRLTDGTYDKPFIEDCGPLRYLHFDLDNVQSVMRHDDPDALCLAYTRKMMSFLLFNAKPGRMLLLGLGGGSLVKFCYRQLPETAITVLEINPHVLALREEFKVPPDDGRFRVVQGDGVAYVAGRARRGSTRNSAERFDVILVDACDRNGMSPTLESTDFYANLKRRLTVNGVLVINVCGDEIGVEGHIGRIRGIFGQQIISLPAREDGNLIVLAFRKEPQTWENGAALDAHARRLEERFGLAFPRYVRGMTRGLAGM